MYLFLTSKETLLAASPIISMSFIRESTSIRLLSRPPLDLSAINNNASLPASSICCNLITSSFCILNHRLRDHIVFEVSAQFLRGTYVHFFSAKDFRKFSFHMSKSKETCAMSLFKLYENIYVTIRSKITPQNRAKKRQFTDTIPLAKFSNFCPWYINSNFLIHLIPLIRRSTFLLTFHSHSD